MYIDAIGFIAAILTTAAFLPQVYKIWKLKSAKDVSMTMYLVMLSGVCLWGGLWFNHKKSTHYCCKYCYGITFDIGYLL